MTTEANEPYNFDDHCADCVTPAVYCQRELNEIGRASHRNNDARMKAYQEHESELDSDMTEALRIFHNDGWAYVAEADGDCFVSMEDGEVHRRSVELLRRYYAHVTIIRRKLAAPVGYYDGELTGGTITTPIAFCTENLVDTWLLWPGSAPRKFLSLDAFKRAMAGDAP